MSQDPIFIIGTERSGSNLLRLILNAHSRIAIPHPPHIIHYFEKWEHSYGDLNNARAMKRLIRDVLSLLKTHIYPWEIEVPAEKIFQDASPRDLFGVYYAIYHEYLRYAGKRRWGCKSTFMIHHASRVLGTFPSAKFIWLVRDPRDVAVSSRQSVFSHFHPLYTALLWRAQQLEGFRLLESLPKDNLLLVKYEDLIADPEGVIRGLCEFLKESYEPEMMNYYQSSAARKSGELSQSWKNASLPIISDNKNKYRKFLTAKEIRIVEGVAGELMQKFGYAAEFPYSSTPLIPLGGERFLFRIQDRLWYIRTEWRSLFYDRNHWLRWRRAWLMKKIGLACWIRSVFMQRRKGRDDSTG
jgi:hypothetical protein